MTRVPNFGGMSKTLGHMNQEMNVQTSLKIMETKFGGKTATWAAILGSIGGVISGRQQLKNLVGFFWRFQILWILIM